MKSILGLSFGLVTSILLGGCASTHAPQQQATNNVDPYEHFNRKIYTFNTKVDNYVLKPVAEGYVTVTPAVVRHGVTNAFNNVDMITTVPNDILQGKFVYAVSDGWRFIINSTAGVGGLFDVATKLGIPAHHEDFGLTLAQWGLKKNSPYLMLPLLGPSNPRDTIGLFVDYMSSPWPYIRPWWIPTTVLAIKSVNTRANLLPADKLVKNSFDPYIFVREASIQARQQQIEDNQLTYNQYAAKKRNQYSDNVNDQNTLGEEIGTMASPPPSTITPTANGQVHATSSKTS